MLVPGDVERYFGDGFSTDVIYRTQTSGAAETQPQRKRRNVEDIVEDIGVWLTRNP